MEGSQLAANVGAEEIKYIGVSVRIGKWSAQGFYINYVHWPNQLFTCGVLLFFIPSSIIFHCYGHYHETDISRLI